MDNYRILGIKKNATRDEIIKAYKMHHLKYKSLGSGITREQEEEFKRIEKAYNELMGYEINNEDMSEKKQNPILKFFKIDQEKFENFWMYNKAKVFIAIFIIFMVWFYISQMANRTQYDLNMAFAGSFKMVDEKGKDIFFETGLIEKDLTDRCDFIKEPLVSYYKQDIYADKQQISGNQALQQKFVIELVNGMIDVMILDKSTFTYYASKGFLMDLADFSKDNNVPEDKKMYAVFVDNKGNKFDTVYGIDIKNTVFINDNRIVSADGDVIACIVKNSKKNDNALKVLQVIINQVVGSE